MTIRKATVEDIPQLVSLWHELTVMHAAMSPMFEMFDNADEHHKEHLKTSLIKDNYHLLVAELDDVIIGYSAILLSNRPEAFLKRRNGSIQDTFVKPEYRKTGIGRQLTNALINIAKDNGIEILTLFVAVDNKEGNSFWQEIGFNTTLN